MIFTLFSSKKWKSREISLRPFYGREADFKQNDKSRFFAIRKTKKIWSKFLSFLSRAKRRVTWLTSGISTWFCVKNPTPKTRNPLGVADFDQFWVHTGERYELKIWSWHLRRCPKGQFWSRLKTRFLVILTKNGLYGRKKQFWEVGCYALLGTKKIVKMTKTPFTVGNSL